MLIITDAKINRERKGRKENTYVRLEEEEEKTNAWWFRCYARLNIKKKKSKELGMGGREDTDRGRPKDARSAPREDGGRGQHAGAEP